MDGIRRKTVLLPFAIILFLSLTACSSISAPLIAKKLPDKKIERSTSTETISYIPETQEEETQQSDVDFVLNTNTGKFHLPGCASILDINEKNRRDFSGTRDDVINQGYQPCKRCNP